MPTSRKKTSVPNIHKNTVTVDDYMASLEHPHREAIQELREFILAVDSRIKEQVKWNAPSFYLEDDFATLRIHPAPILQLVLYSGPKKKPNAKPFVIPDPHNLVEWAAMDRCVITFESLTDVRSKKAALKPIIAKWISQL
jgi:hypothetical protein